MVRVGGAELEVEAVLHVGEGVSGFDERRQDFAHRRMVLRPPPARIRRHPDVDSVAAADQDAIFAIPLSVCVRVGWYPRSCRSDFLKFWNGEERRQLQTFRFQSQHTMHGPTTQRDIYPTGPGGSAGTVAACSRAIPHFSHKRIVSQKQAHILIIYMN